MIDRRRPQKQITYTTLPFLFPSHSGIRWGKSNTLISSKSLLIRWVRDWFVVTPSSHHHLVISVELDERAYYLSILRGPDTSPQTTSALGNKQIGFVVPVRRVHHIRVCGTLFTDTCENIVFGPIPGRRGRVVQVIVFFVRAFLFWAPSVRQTFSSVLLRNGT